MRGIVTDKISEEHVLDVRFDGNKNSLRNIFLLKIQSLKIRCNIIKTGLSETVTGGIHFYAPADSRTPLWR